MTQLKTLETLQGKERWTALIDEICEGTWVNPLTDKAIPPAPYDRIVIRDSLKGQEADLVSSLGMTAPFTIVADKNTWDAMGARVKDALEPLGEVKTVILDQPHADMQTVESLEKCLSPADSVVAVGSGTINDLCKFVTHRNGGRYCVFGTAASMNGYTSTTASITLHNGLKVSLPAHAPSGFFVDLSVSARAPTHLAASGFADCLCRSVAQIDWWMSHRVLGTVYRQEPYLMELPDEAELNKRARLLPQGNTEAVGYLYRVLTLCGLGIGFTGQSHHGSMAEHQVSHYIDCFAGDRHPGTLHGQQVGVASLAMARIQHHFLSQETPPKVRATQIDFDDMKRRMGPEIAKDCYIEYRKKAFDEAGAASFNEKISAIWPELRQECLKMAIPVEKMEEMLRASGGPATAKELGVPLEFWREAVRFGHEMRNRFAFVDIACDSGILDEFAAAEV